ncbi:hypothetical protein ACFWIX_00855 [Pseudarthrobacter sp. NPDC058362]|uniref:hypothetical protein n=1 Tax=unclassified Pseudarthrobacter TaxID=2647000 RepID=UPI0036642D96
MTIESPDSLPEGESQDITATTGEKNDGGIPAGADGVGVGADDTRNTFEPEEVPHGLEKPETD